MPNLRKYHDPKESKLLAMLKTPEGWQRVCDQHPQAPHPIYPMVTAQRMIDFIECGYGDAYVMGMLLQRAEGIILEKTQPIFNGFDFPMWLEADELWAKGRELLILGGNRCLGGETEIYDPVAKISRRVDSIRGKHHVLAWDGRRVVVAEAEEPFKKPKEILYAVSLNNGQQFTASGGHRVYGYDPDHRGTWGERTSEGWRYVEKLRFGDPVFGLGNLRVLKITAGKTPKTVWDFTVPKHGNYFCAGALHHNSSKSTYAAKRTVQTLMTRPGAYVWVFSTSFETSVRDAQRLIWQYLPPQWKNLKRGKVANVSYTQKGGFSQKVFVAPNGSECRFMNYAQDSDVIEGGQIDLWWADELIPADWIITLRSRVIDRKGRGIVTQTPIKGYTNTVAEYLTGARVLEWAKCEFFPEQQLWAGAEPGTLPYKMQCMNSSRHVMFFHSKNNPYVPYEDLVQEWKDKGTSQVLCRLYGVTSGASHTKFPRFGNHNIVPHEKIPQKGTNYHIVDFSWEKPWAMLWLRVVRVADKRLIYVYREWPDADTYGEWVMRSDRPDGYPGPAQHPCGFGISQYKRVILDAEGHGGPPGTQPEVVFSRYGDPRSGASTALVDDGATSIFQLLEAQTDQAPSMLIEPVTYTANQWHITEGVNMINEWLAYDIDKPISLLNQPSLYISDKCTNLIDCMRIWTGKEGDKGASKDFIDLLRYAAMVGIDDASFMERPLREGGSY